jgi:hypothetical protein
MVIGDDGNGYAPAFIVCRDNLLMRFAVKAVRQFLDRPRLARSGEIQKHVDSLSKLFAVVESECAFEAGEESSLSFCTVWIPCFSGLPGHVDNKR